jgi:hypothetical protein
MGLTNSRPVFCDCGVCYECINRIKSVNSSHYHSCDKVDLCKQCLLNLGKNVRLYKLRENLPKWEEMLQPRMCDYILFNHQKDFRKRYIWISAGHVESALRKAFQQKWIPLSERDKGHNDRIDKTRSSRIDELIEDNVKFWKAVEMVTMLTVLKYDRFEGKPSQYLGLEKVKRKIVIHEIPPDDNNGICYIESCGILAASKFNFPKVSTTSIWDRTLTEQLAQGTPDPDFQCFYRRQEVDCSNKKSQSANCICYLLKYREECRTKYDEPVSESMRSYTIETIPTPLDYLWTGNFPF